MRTSLKILTGKPNRYNPYWAGSYPGPTFIKLGHQVVQDGLFRPGYDMAFIVQNQWKGARKWLGYPTGMWSIDSKFQREHYRKQGKKFDVFFVDKLDEVPKYKEFSNKAVYLPFACDPEIHKGIPTEELFDIGYVGKKWEPRVTLLKSLRENGLKVNAYFNRSTNKNSTWQIPFKSLIPWSEACKLYSQCKMIFNFSKDAGLNKRVYEGMSIGKLVLTNRRGSEPDNLFVDGKHLVVYDDEKDLLEKARYYSTHPEERQAIAQAGQEIVHEKHKWTDRMQFVIETLLGK